MEKKTLGAFIALLRKEKGLTQRQLAELLNVSDKTVSHWECDENSPDISSLLPVLSEALGVSVDELLKGERKIIQPTVEQPYIPHKSESFTEKASGLASRTVNKIKSKMTGDIAERYRYFRMLSLIGTVIALVVLLSISLINLVAGTFLGNYMADDMLFLPGIIAFIGSLWTLAISLGFTLGARFAFAKGITPSPEANEGERKYISRANAFTFNNIFLVFSSLPMALTGINILDVSALTNVSVAIFILAVLWVALIAILNKKSVLRTEKKKMLAVKYLGMFGLSFILVAGSVWFITEEVWFPTAKNIVFSTPEEFKAYMETPKEKPADSYRIDGVTATIAISDGIIIEEDDDYVRNERVYGDAPGGVIVDFAWHNKEVYSYSYNAEDKTFHVITYEAKINQKDTQILIDDGVPVALVMFCIIDAVVCFCLYKKKLREII